MVDYINISPDPGGGRWSGSGSPKPPLGRGVLNRPVGNCCGGSGPNGSKRAPGGTAPGGRYEGFTGGRLL